MRSRNSVICALKLPVHVGTMWPPGCSNCSHSSSSNVDMRSMLRSFGTCKAACSHLRASDARAKCRCIHDEWSRHQSGEQTCTDPCCVTQCRCTMSHALSLAARCCSGQAAAHTRGSVPWHLPGRKCLMSAQIPWPASVNLSTWGLGAGIRPPVECCMRRER